MKILLIGATGQIGYALATLLASSSHSLTVLVRDKAKLNFAPNISLIKAPVFNEKVFEQALEGHDAVVYGLGLPEQFAPTRGMFDEVNLGLTTLFLKAIAKSNVKRLIYISTYEIFQSVEGVIRESHSLETPAKLSPYFSAMVRAFAQVKEVSLNHGISLTTIHPAAVYGGRDTSDGITHYVENILNRRYLKIPTILVGRFPVVHADSLARAISLSIDHEGAFIVSEAMTSLQEIAHTLRQFAPCFVPPQLPKVIVYTSITLMEAFAKISGTRPLLSVSQLDFITKGDEPLATKAQDVLGWEAMTLSSGLEKYMANRLHLLN
jgi:nucleoside-diphosphate-sugar epimerase